MIFLEWRVNDSFEHLMNPGHIKALLFNLDDVRQADISDTSTVITDDFQSIIGSDDFASVISRLSDPIKVASNTSEVSLTPKTEGRGAATVYPGIQAMGTPSSARKVKPTDPDPSHPDREKVFPPASPAPSCEGHERTERVRTTLTSATAVNGLGEGHFLRRVLAKPAHRDGEDRPSIYPDWYDYLDKLEGREGGPEEADADTNIDWLFWLDSVPHNPQQSVFLGGKHGPFLNIFLVRAHVMLQSVYVAIVAIFFIPFIYEEYGLLWGTLFLLVSVLPLIIHYLTFFIRMIVQMVMVSKCNCLIDPVRLADVIRAQKLQKVVTLLVTLTKVQSSQSKVKRDKERSSGGIIDRKLQMEIDAVSRIYDLYDTDGDGACVCAFVRRLF